MRTGILTYADGTTFQAPVIMSSNNGWFYKPDEMRTEREIRRGLNRSFPRKSGSYDSEQYVEKALREHHILRNWEKPVEDTNRKNSPRSGRYGDSLTASFFDVTFGWVSMTMHIRKDRPRKSHNELDVGTSFSITGSALLGLLLDKQVENNGDWSAQSSEEFRARVSEQVQAFMEDPFGIIQAWFPTHNLDKYLSPPDFSDEEYARDADWDKHVHETIFTDSSNNGLFYRKGVIKEILQSQVHWEKVKLFFEALEFVGFTIKPSWSFGYGNYTDRTLNGLTIKIPERGEQHQHTIDINASNPYVTIECGYMRDEERWLDRKKRESIEQMADLEDSLKTFEYEIELMERNE